MSTRGGSRGGAPRGRGGGPSKGAPVDKKKKESILNLANYVDQSVKITFMGGREVTGTLKGYDQLMNLVMDDVVEEFEGTFGDCGGASGELERVEWIIADLADQARPSRTLGLVVLRGPNIALISPTDGSAEIENPFQQS